ncbi:MAG: DUF72 domain-containing protein [Calditrichaeota bacterium]|nr:MAG: DUF72 domain-containing protein [Calditrichota bacterium]
MTSLSGFLLDDQYPIFKFGGKMVKPSWPEGMHIGTCSWKYESWIGLVYSPEAAKNYLQEYAQSYDTVEIDQWFWSLFPQGKVKLPNPTDVHLYASSVSASFRFTIKVPNAVTLTHYYSPKAPLVRNPHFLSVQVMLDFMQTLQPLHQQIGTLMLQFEYLNRAKMASQQALFQQLEAFITQCPRDFPIAIEIRNPNYINASYFDFLNRHNLHHVFLQGYYMPSIFELYQQYKKYIQSRVIIRLHGPDRQGMEEKSHNVWNRLLESKDDELDQLLSMMADLQYRNVETYINVNNHYEGSAPLTIERIRERLVKREND